jgi:parallel beta-helix repeat protein
LRMIDTVTNADVEDNTITGNTSFGIFTDAATTAYLITGNTISGNGTNVSLGSADGTYVP